MSRPYSSKGGPRRPCERCSRACRELVIPILFESYVYFRVSTLSLHATVSRSWYYFVRVPGMFHLNLLDLPLLSPLTSWLGITGAIDGQRAHNIINAFSRAFFDRRLKSLPAVLLDDPAEQYP